MDCQEIKRYLYAFLDDELDVKTNLEIQSHLCRCSDCQTRFEFEKRMRLLMGEHQLREEAPAYLRDRLPRTIEESERGKGTPLRSFLAPRLRPVSGLILSASVIAVLAIIFLVYFNRREDMSAFASEAVNNHLMYFFGETPAEFESSEARDVNSWFKGKFDFVVDVPEFRGGGPKLVGGRLCSIDNKRAAYIMYKYKDKGYNLSLFAFSNADMKPSSRKVVEMGGKAFYVNEFKGHNVILWKEGNIIYSMVSDINEDELMELTKLVLSR